MGANPGYGYDTSYALRLETQTEAVGTQRSYILMGSAVQAVQRKWKMK